MTPFQMIVSAVFVVLTIVGVGMFAIFGGLGGAESVGKVVVWGTVDQTTMDTVLSNLSQQDKLFQDVIYISKKASTYETELVNAIAAGTGPDLIFLTEDNMGSLADKVGLIPYSSISQSTFISSFIDEGQLFLTPQGILALPLTIDPLVMYWNRDIFTNAGVAQPPQYWDDVITLAPKMTSLESGAVRKSAVAMGTWSNVNHAKEILSALFMQTGDFVTDRDQQGKLVITLGNKPTNANEAPAAGALRFYTDFANPSKTTYSWNRSLPLSFNAFTSGDLAMYFGLASEYRRISERNPNLHFGVALVPQLKGSPTKITSGNITGLAIARGASNPTGAMIVAQRMTGQAAVAAIAQETGLPPVRRDVRVDTSASAAAETFVQSALMSRSWSDPNLVQSDRIFQGMIESVMAGRLAPEAAVFEAAQAMRQLVPSF